MPTETNFYSCVPMLVSKFRSRKRPYHLHRETKVLPTRTVSHARKMRTSSHPRFLTTTSRTYALSSTANVEMIYEEGQSVSELRWNSYEVLSHLERNGWTQNGGPLVR